ncbi:hypothetical protein BH23ACT2_BH23ACT2_30060 [soil metagenome]
MATNLRLRPDAADALRREAQRTGRSQQDVIRAAIDRHLSLTPAGTQADDLGVLVAAGAVRRPRIAYRRATTRLPLPPGVRGTDLLDRHDRI